MGDIYGINRSTGNNQLNGTTTETAIKSWSQSNINSYIGSEFKRKSNSLPVLNINLNIYNNYIF